MGTMEMLDVSRMDAADVIGSLSGLDDETKSIVAMGLLAQYFKAGPNDEFLIVRTRESSNVRHHVTHHQMALRVEKVPGYRALLSSLTFRPGADDRLGWFPAGRKTVRKSLNKTARAFGHTVN